MQDYYLISSYANLSKENLCKMRFSFAAVAGMFLAAAPALVSAQDPSQPQGGGMMVMVGQGGQFTFTPPQMTAAVNTNITFMFMSKNHSVVQSSFNDPCNPLANGFAAEYFPVAPDTTTFPTVTIAVTTDKPIWFYCPQTIPANHCKAGMVGAINPTPDKTFEQFQAIAKGEQPPPAASSGSSSVAAGSPTSSSQAPTGAPTTGSTPPANGGAPVGGTSTGALPNSTGSPTSSDASQPTSAALPQLKGAFTAVVIGILGVVASLL